VITLRSQPCSAVRSSTGAAGIAASQGCQSCQGWSSPERAQAACPSDLQSPAQPSPSQAKPSPSQAKLPAHLVNHFFEHLQHLGQVATLAVGCSKGTAPAAGPDDAAGAAGREISCRLCSLKAAACNL
jgi:hypothetical protein